MVDKIHALLLIPYQLLQLIGYRLAGVQCRYEFGSFGVEPRGQATYTQHLVGKFFPTVIIFLGLILQIATGVYLARMYQASIPFIPLLFVLLSTPPLALYLHYARFDLRQKVQIFNSKTLSGRKY